MKFFVLWWGVHSWVSVGFKTLEEANAKADLLKAKGRKAVFVEAR